MGIRRWQICSLVGAMAILGAAGEGRAATKLCFDPPGPTFEVPERPSFIIERRDLDDSFGIYSTHRRRGASFSYSIEVLDDHFARVTVDAVAGDVIRDPGFIRQSSGACRVDRFRVVKRWSVRDRSVTPIAARMHHGVVQLELSSAAPVAWTQIDWAHSAEDLTRGLHGTRIVDAREPIALDPEDVGIAADAPMLLFVRLRRSTPDGKAGQPWEGWIHRAADGSIRIGDGPPPALPHVGSVRCVDPVRAPRSVPVNPSFLVGDHAFTRFHATSLEGAPLEVTTAPEPEGRWLSRVTVRAPEGTRFFLHQLPMVPGCPTGRALRATADRTHDEAPEVTAVSSSSRIYFSVELAEPQPWRWFDVEWAATGDLRTWKVEKQRVTASELWMLGMVHVDHSFWSLTITPVADDGTRGPAWRGWVRRDPASETVLAFGELPAPVARPSGLPHAACARVVPRASEPRSTTWLLAIAVLGLAAIASWLAGRRATPLP